jgi:hypothetical protein
MKIKLFVAAALVLISLEAQASASECQTKEDIVAWMGVLPGHSYPASTLPDSETNMNQHFCAHTMPWGVEIAFPDKVVSAVPWQRAQDICGALTLNGKKWKAPGISVDNKGNRADFTDGESLEGRTGETINNYIYVLLEPIIQFSPSFWSSSKSIEHPNYAYGFACPTCGDENDNIYFYQQKLKSRVLCVEKP